MDAVFFDFDGVILDSVDVKTVAFRDMFAGFGPGVQAAVTDYHLLHGGVSRVEKFKHFYGQLLGRALPDELLAQLCADFSALTLAKVLEAPFIAGARETLEALREHGVPVIVASGTPQEDLEAIVSGRGLGGLFAEVHGSPATKAEIIRDVLARHGYSRQACLFVGDAMTDYHAAKECGLRFLGVCPPGRSPFPLGTPVVPALSYAGLKETL